MKRNRDRDRSSEAKKAEPEQGIKGVSITSKKQGEERQHTVHFNYHFA